MSLVVDSSLLVAAVVDSGPEGHWAEDILTRGALASPEIVLVEAANILRRLELTGRLTLLEAAPLIRICWLLTSPCSPMSPSRAASGNFAAT